MTTSITINCCYYHSFWKKSAKDNYTTEWNYNKYETVLTPLLRCLYNITRIMLIVHIFPVDWFAHNYFWSLYSWGSFSSCWCVSFLYFHEGLWGVKMFMTASWESSQFLPSFLNDGLAEGETLLLPVRKLVSLWLSFLSWPSVHSLW